jgi:hypothetical protein
MYIYFYPCSCIHSHTSASTCYTVHQLSILQQKALGCWKRTLCHRQCQFIFRHLLNRYHDGSFGLWKAPLNGRGLAEMKTWSKWDLTGEGWLASKEIGWGGSHNMVEGLNTRRRMWGIWTEEMASRLKRMKILVVSVMSYSTMQPRTALQMLPNRTVIYMS